MQQQCGCVWFDFSGNEEVRMEKRRGINLGFRGQERGRKVDKEGDVVGIRNSCSESRVRS